MDIEQADYTEEEFTEHARRSGEVLCSYPHASLTGYDFLRDVETPTTCPECGAVV